MNACGINGLPGPQVVIPPDRRVYAIGDTHGYKDLLIGLFGLIARDLCDNPLHPGQEHTFVLLGDYVDRGPDSKGLIDLLVERAAGNPRHIFLKGNHDDDFLYVIRYLAGDMALSWHHAEQIALSSFDTYRSYGARINWRAEWSIDELQMTIPPAHKEFLETLTNSATFGRYLFIHNPDDAFGKSKPTHQELEEIRTYLWKGPASVRTGFIGPDHPVRQQTIVHGHIRFATAKTAYRHRIGLDMGLLHDGRFYGDVVNCAVLEQNKRPRLLSFPQAIP